MTTGEGGCVATRDEALAKKISLLRFHGMDREAWNRFGKSGNQDYEIVMPGFKYNMMDLQAALGIHQLKALDGFIERRNCAGQSVSKNTVRLAAVYSACSAVLSASSCMASLRTVSQYRNYRFFPR